MATVLFGSKTTNLKKLQKIKRNYLATPIVANKVLNEFTSKANTPSFPIIVIGRQKLLSKKRTNLPMRKYWRMHQSWEEEAPQLLLPS